MMFKGQNQKIAGRAAQLWAERCDCGRVAFGLNPSLRSSHTDSGFSGKSLVGNTIYVGQPTIDSRLNLD
jgi:hypothetical protein